MASESALERDIIDPQTAFAELGKIMLGVEPMGAVLERIAHLARRAMPAVDEVSVTLLEGQKAKTAVFTGSLAVQLDERQYNSGFGPCLDAAVSGQTILVDTAAPDSAYPDFANAALRQGVTQTVSVGMPVPDRVVGALNMYASSDGPVDPETLEVAKTFASYAAVAVANAALYASTAALAEQMQLAMQSRSVIEQAKGILIARHGYSSDDAFQALVKVSQHSNRKLRDVAQALVASTASHPRDGQHVDGR